MMFSTKKKLFLLKESNNYLTELQGTLIEAPDGEGC